MTTLAFIGPADGAPISRAGWTLVWTLSVGQLISWGTLYYAFAVYALPMEQELGWSKAELNGALSLGLLVNGLFALPVGAWIDRHGGRWIMLAGSLAGGALLLLWSATTGLFAFYAVWAALGVVLSAVLYEPAFAVLTANLGPHYRRAITVMTLLGGLASTVFIPLTQLLIEWLGWRHSLVVLAAFNLIVCAGIHAVFLKGTRPGLAPMITPVPGAIQMPAARSPLGRALRTPSFWGMLIGFAGYGFAFSALTFHLIPLLAERGMETGTIVLLMALIGPMQVCGRLLLLAGGPRLTARMIGRVTVVMQPVAVLVLVLAPPTVPWVALFAALYGMSNGMLTIVRGTIVPEVLGSEGYATINGAIAFPVTILKAAAPVAAAALWAAGSGYDFVLWCLFVVYCVTTVALWAATGRGRTVAAG
jgi:MFS family permease